MQKKTIIIGIATFAILLALLVLRGKDAWLERRVAEQERCGVPAELKDFVYDEGSFRSPELARFALRAKFPQELLRDPQENTTRIGGVGFSFGKGYEGPGGTRVEPIARYFTMALTHYTANPRTTLEEIGNRFSIAERSFPAGNLPPGQGVIQKLSGPEDLAEKGLGPIGCIRDFWTENQITEAYLVEPKTQESLDYFELQGVAHQPPGGDEDAIESPFGLYATRLYDGIPMTLHFVWARSDQDIFFRDKPYSVFDVLWSVRFSKAR